jgi:hypothetical protein
LVVTLTPGPHPFEQLWKAVRQAGADEVDWRADRLDLLRTLQALLPADESRLLLVVDQFEELVTQTSSPAERDRFVANLVEVIEEPESGIVVLLTVRADFFAHVLDVPSLGRLALEGLVGVVPMSPEQVEVAAAAPAEGVGVGIEPELAAVLVADMTNQPGALPLFQYALTEAFDARTAGVLTRAGYRAVGGLRGAVARRAEETFQTLGDDEREAARQVFLRLVTIGLATRTPGGGSPAGRWSRWGCRRRRSQRCWTRSTGPGCSRSTGTRCGASPRSSLPTKLSSPSGRGWPTGCSRFVTTFGSISDWPPSSPSGRPAATSRTTS